MAARKKKAARRKASKPVELIISKARTKAAVKKCNVGGEFYGRSTPLCASSSRKRKHGPSATSARRSRPSISSTALRKQF